MITNQDNWRAQGRAFLKSDRWEEWFATPNDQKNNLPAPPLEKPAPKGSVIVPLPNPKIAAIANFPLFDAIAQRRTHRKYAAAPISIEELSFLLWATQVVHEIFR